MEDLLFTWEDSVNNFFKYVIECCGYEEFTDEYRSLKFLVSDMNDLNRFIDVYDGNLGDLMPTINRMRELKCGT